MMNSTTSTNFKIKPLIRIPTIKINPPNIMSIKREITALRFNDVNNCNFLISQCIICKKRNITNCNCVRQKYLNSITHEMVDRYVSKKDSLEGENLINYVNTGK